jgi:hypothetical protein
VCLSNFFPHTKKSKESQILLINFDCESKTMSATVITHHVLFVTCTLFLSMVINMNLFVASQATNCIGVQCTTALCEVALLVTHCYGYPCLAGPDELQCLTSPVLSSSCTSCCDTNTCCTVLTQAQCSEDPTPGDCVNCVMMTGAHMCMLAPSYRQYGCTCVGLGTQCRNQASYCDYCTASPLLQACISPSSASFCTSSFSCVSLNSADFASKNGFASTESFCNAFSDTCQYCSSSTFTGCISKNTDCDCLALNTPAAATDNGLSKDELCTSYLNVSGHDYCKLCPFGDVCVQETATCATSCLEITDPATCNFAQGCQYCSAQKICVSSTTTCDCHSLQLNECSSSTGCKWCENRNLCSNSTTNPNCLCQDYT